MRPLLILSVMFLSACSSVDRTVTPYVVDIASQSATIAFKTAEDERYWLLLRTESGEYTYEVQEFQYHQFHVGDAVMVKVVDGEVKEIHR